MWPNLQLVIFTEVILNRKLHFLCSDNGCHFQVSFFLRCWKLLYNDFSTLVLVETVVSFWLCDWNYSKTVEKICFQNKMLIILIISVGHSMCSEIWNPMFGEELNVRIEPNNYVDKFTVSVERFEKK